MLNLKIILLTLTLTALNLTPTSSQSLDDSSLSESARKHHYKHLWLHHYHLLYYLGLFALKIKFIFTIGIIYSIFLASGKIIALIKYFDSKTHHYEPVHFHGHEYGRSNLPENALEAFSLIVESSKLNLTEQGFKEMNLTSTECKKRFVCEAEFGKKESFILRKALDILSDEEYDKYKSDKEVEDKEDCRKLYSCEQLDKRL